MELDFENGTILLVDKPFKWTSFDVVNFIRKAAKVKVGHAGTLDPLATGLLIICTGKMTKKIDSFQAQEKEYTGIIRLGSTTPSFDLETEVDQLFNTDNLTLEGTIAAAKKLTGTFNQIAPAHSAKWIDGERAYLKARRGETVEVKPREVSVDVFEINDFIKHEQGIDVHFRIVCSKGTYIRSLARDLGLGLGNGGHLIKLVRTRIGEFKLDQAISIDDFRKSYPLPVKPANVN